MAHGGTLSHTGALSHLGTMRCLCGDAGVSSVGHRPKLLLGLPNQGDPAWHAISAFSIRGTSVVWPESTIFTAYQT